MSGVITAVAVTGLVGAAVGADASRRAGNTQADAARQASDTGLTATRESNALNWEMYQQNLRNQAPYMQGGGQAYAALLAGMGLDPMNNFAGPTPMAGGSDGRMYAGGSGGLVNTDTPEGRAVAQSAPLPEGRATTQQARPGDRESGFRGMITDGGRSVETVPVRPTTPTTLSDLNGYQNETTRNYGSTPEQVAAAGRTYGANGGVFRQTFGAGDLGLDPSYQFRMNEGTRNLMASAASRGLTGSGQNLKDITNYGQNAASQEYQSAYDRFMNNQTTQYNRLAALASTGQSAAAGVGNAGMQTGQNIAQNTMSGVNASNQMLTGAAAANAAGAVGQANAITGGINNGMNTWMGMQFLNRNRPTNGAYWGQLPNGGPTYNVDSIGP